MRLQRIFLVLGGLLYLVMLGLIVYTVFDALRRIHHSSAGVEAIQQLQKVLVVTEMASRERGPSNGLLSSDTTNQQARQQALAQARERTNQAFNAMRESVRTPNAKNTLLLENLNQAEHNLRLARKEIDVTASLPRGNRAPEQIRAAIDLMFMVIDDLNPAVVNLTNDATGAYPQLTNLVLAAARAADLREYAGRLGSHFTVALTQRQQIQPSELQSIQQLLGRIDQLHRQLQERIKANANRPTLDKAVEEMNRRYFGSAIPFIQEQLAIGLSHARYEHDAASFAARYVPDMDAILALRDVLLQHALDDAEQNMTAARTAAFWFIGAIVVFLVLLAAILALLRYRVYLPLQESARLILAVADGNLDIPLPKMRYQDELSDVVHAIGILRNNSVQRLALEEERQKLLEQLKAQSNTDFLTGLYNRRAFYEVANPTFSNAQRQGFPISLAIFDIDFFKRVNDTHGHEVGDQVLVEMAQLCRTHVRNSDVVARYGGEEFLLFMPYCDLTEGARKSEDLRALIEAREIPLPNGGILKITASFGVADLTEDTNTVSDLIQRADENLYKAKQQGRNRVIA